MFDIILKTLKNKHREDSDRDLLHHILAHVHQLLETQNFIIEKLNEMGKELDDLTAQVADVETVEQSAIVLLDGLKQKLDDAIASGDPAQLTALSNTLGTGKQSLADAISRNTPAAPPADGGGTAPAPTV